MAARAIGIDVGPGQVRAVQLLRTRHGVRVERAAVRVLGDDGVAAALRDCLQEAGFRAGAPAAVGAPPGSVFFQDLDTDLPKLDYVRRVLAFELEDDFPLPAERLVMGVCGARPLAEGSQRVLVGAVDRAALRRGVEQVGEAGLACRMVDADAAALCAVVAENHPALARSPFVAAHAWGQRAVLAVGQGDALLAGRHVQQSFGQALAREVELMWREAFGKALPGETCVVVTGEEAAAALRDELPCAVTVLDLFGRVGLPEDGDVSGEFALAIGRALRCLDGAAPGLNFLLADTREESHAAALRRGLVTLGVLLALMGVVWTGGLYLRLHGLSVSYGQLRAETRALFRRVLPDEPVIVSELPQMQARLAALRKEYDTFAAVAGGAVGPMRLLQTISARTPPGLRVKVTDMAISGRSVRLAGTADSVTSVDALKNALLSAPEFTAAEIQDVGMDRGTNALRFTILLTAASR